MFIKNSFKKEFSDPLNITMSHIAVVVWMLSVIVFYRVLFSHINEIGGWSWAESLILIGTYFTIDGLIYTLFYWNVHKIKNYVKDKKLGTVLVKPISSQFLMSTQEIQASMYIQFITTGVFIALGVSKLGFSISLLQIASYLLFILLGGLIAYSIWFIFTCAIFWIPNIDNIIHFFEEIFTFAQFPSGIFSGVFKIFAKFFIPLILMTSIPSQILTGKVKLQDLLITIILTLVLLTTSQLVWKLGIRKYTRN